MAAHVVGRVCDIPPGSRRVVSIDGTSVGVFNVDGRYYALRNACPHQGGPLCVGEVTGTTESDDPADIRWVRDGEILRCPWHHWEFDLTSGRALFNPNRRVKTYEVSVRAANGAGAEPGGDRGDQLVVIDV